MASITARFPGQHCVECGAEFIPSETLISVHPTMRGPKGGKKYVHANPSECGMRRNPLSDLTGGQRRKKKYTDSYVAGSDSAKGLLNKYDPAVVAELDTTAAWGSAQRAGLVDWASKEDPQFFEGFIDTLPAVRRQAQSMASGYESSDIMSRYNPRRMRRNAGRRTSKGESKAGRLPKMESIGFLPEAGTAAPYHRTDARSMSSKDLVALGSAWAKQELRRRGRGPDGVKLAWKE
jgi:hypothetical protein